MTDCDTDVLTNTLGKGPVRVLARQDPGQEDAAGGDEYHRRELRRQYDDDDIEEDKAYNQW